MKKVLPKFLISTILAITTATAPAQSNLNSELSAKITGHVTAQIEDLSFNLRNFNDKLSDSINVFLSENRTIDDERRELQSMINLCGGEIARLNRFVDMYSTVDALKISEGPVLDDTSSLQSYTQNLIEISAVCINLKKILDDSDSLPHALVSSLNDSLKAQIRENEREITRIYARLESFWKTQ